LGRFHPLLGFHPHHLHLARAEDRERALAKRKDEEEMMDGFGKTEAY
jgi:hypothetical protein